MKFMPAALLSAAAAILLACPSSASAQFSPLGGVTPFNTPRAPGGFATGFIFSVETAPVFSPFGLAYPPTTVTVVTLNDGQRILLYRFTRVDVPQPFLVTGFVQAFGFRRADGTLVATRLVLT